MVIYEHLRQKSKRQEAIAAETREQCDKLRDAVTRLAAELVMRT